MDHVLRYNRRALEAIQPIGVYLELTYHCNWRCLFCYNPRHFDLRRMSATEWMPVLDDLRTLGTLTITLTGGEPLTHPEFFPIARAIRERGFALRVFTNGSLIDDAAADQLAELYASVEVSLHGATAATHERATAKAGSFEALLAGIRRLRQRNVALVVKTPVTIMNVAELPQMIDMMEAMGVTYQVDPSITARDDGSREPLQYAIPAEAMREVARILGARPPLQRTRGEANCGLGRSTMAIGPEGDVYPCMQWRQSSLGNVRQTPLRELWLGSDVRKEAAGVAVAANDLLMDRGGAAAEYSFCPALAQKSTGDPLVPDDVFLARAQHAADLRAGTPVK